MRSRYSRYIQSYTTPRMLYKYVNQCAMQSSGSSTPPAQAVDTTTTTFTHQSEMCSWYSDSLATPSVASVLESILHSDTREVVAGTRSGHKQPLSGTKHEGVLCFRACQAHLIRHLSVFSASSRRSHPSFVASVTLVALGTCTSHHYSAVYTCIYCANDQSVSHHWSSLSMCTHCVALPTL